MAAVIVQSVLALTASEQERKNKDVRHVTVVLAMNKLVTDGSFARLSTGLHGAGGGVVVGRTGKIVTRQDVIGVARAFRSIGNLTQKWPDSV